MRLSMVVPMWYSRFVIPKYVELKAVNKLKSGQSGTQLIQEVMSNFKVANKK